MERYSTWPAWTWTSDGRMPACDNKAPQRARRCVGGGRTQATEARERVGEGWQDVRPQLLHAERPLRNMRRQHREAALRRAPEAPEHPDSSKVYQLKPPEESPLKCGGHRWLPGTDEFVLEGSRWAVVEETAEKDVYEDVGCLYG